MKFKYLLIPALLLVATICFSQNLNRMTLVSTATATGDQFYVDTSTISTLEGGSRSVVTLMKKGYKDTPRPVFNALEGNVQKAVYQCNNAQYAYIESREIDKDGNIIKTEFVVQPDDPRIKYTPIARGTIAEQMLNYVCAYKLPSNASTAPSSSESKILSKFSNNGDWASLGPDSTNQFDFYALKNSVTKRGNYIGFVSKGEYRTPIAQKGITYKTVVSENIIDCKQSKTQILKTEYLNEQGLVVLEEKIDPEFAPWDSIVQGSFNGRIQSVYCK